MTAAVDTMGLARDERVDLADLLATLTPDQWDAPSLCTQWRVRDVVAHMFSYEDLGIGGLVGRFLRAGLRPGRANAVGVAAYADYSHRRAARAGARPPAAARADRGFGGRIALTDGLIHHQDIRRPLGLPREIPADRLLCRPATSPDRAHHQAPSASADSP